MKAKDLIALLQSIDLEAEIGVGSNNKYYTSSHLRSHGPVTLIPPSNDYRLAGRNCYSLGIWCDHHLPGAVTAWDGKVIPIQEFYDKRLYDASAKPD
jgi:hypothetical protein